MTPGQSRDRRAHPDHYKRYVQDYIARYGVWKCEANALVGNPSGAQALLEEAINHYIPSYHPDEAVSRNEPAQQQVRAEIATLMRDYRFE